MYRRIKGKFLFYKHYLFQAIKIRVKTRGSKSDFWARMYYAFFDSSFVRENRAVLQGKIVHQEGFITGTLNEYKIRRNIHRLEKGLIMPIRRDVFAKDYIMETVKAFVQEQQKKEYNVQMIEWAKDVLNSYFMTVKHEGTINESFELFRKYSDTEKTPVLIPHERLIPNDKTMDYDGFLELCIQRVSTRIFQPKSVHRELLDKAFNAALRSPSACNRQPFEFLVYDKEEDIKKLIKLPGGISGFDKDVPVLIFLIGDLSAYFDERDRHLIYIDGGLVSMSLMLALETLGLASCALNWPDIEEKERALGDALKLPQYKRCILAMTVGYPDVEGGIPYSLKKSMENTVKYNHEYPHR